MTAAAQPEGALLVMPMPAVGGTGPVAVWITAAGWTRAARDRFGDAWMLTPQGVLDAEQARSLATRPGTASRPRAAWRRWVPDLARTLRKDVRNAIRAHRFRDAALDGPWAGKPLAFVLQHHELYHRAGFRAAHRFDCPLVLFVDAPVVWEERRWGTRRPGWGRWLERVAENPQLRAADLVACVSDEVAGELERRGVEPRRLLVTPCSVDVDRFAADPQVRATTRHRLGLDDRFTVGWVGSFRRFHGLDLLIDAFAELRERVPEAALLLVGDGFERQAMTDYAAARGLAEAVVFTGTVPHAEMPGHLAAMDAAVVVDPGRADFHYSPLKLKEYMAAGLAVVAPDSGQLVSLLDDGGNALVVPPGDRAAIRRALGRLHAEPELRAALGQRARTLMEAEGDWSHQLDLALATLDGLPRNPRLAELAR